jgi:prepilin-type N-terminal cleavage/methylation domain-containing protein
MRLYRLQSAFTLVELLVVVAIIVVLLALLLPAMNKAIYHAALVSCGAGNLKVMSTAVTAYAFDNKRFYPDRGIGPRSHRDTNPLPINADTVKRASVNYDIRPIHRKIFPINKTLQCPLAPHVELENEDLVNDSEGLAASYSMFWAWQYKGDARTYPGMFKVGDKFAYDDLFAPSTESRLNYFNVLAGDIDLAWDTGAQSSHPDRDPRRMYEFVVRGEFFIDGRITVGRWVAGGHNRGLLDTNFVFTDGSVSRYDGVTRVDWDPPRRDPRMTRVPINFNNFNSARGYNVDKMHLPLR